MQNDPEKIATNPTSPSLRIERSFESSSTSRLLDVSPPTSRMSMSGLTSDSDYGAPLDKGKQKMPEREHIITTRGTSANDDHDQQLWPQVEHQDSYQPQPTPSPRSAYRDKPPPLEISITPSEPSDRERTSSSTSSSLDPYYFSIPSPTQSSPITQPPTDETPRTQRRASSKRVSLLEPKTPARDPASIDRKGLIGVGELATPRWTLARAPSESQDSGSHSNSPMIYDHSNDDDPAPSWAVSAFDGDGDGDGDDVPAPHFGAQSQALRSPPNSAPLPTRSTRGSRTRSSTYTEESGGEEILYKPPPPRERLPVRTQESSSLGNHASSHRDSNDTITLSQPISPPPEENALASPTSVSVAPSSFHNHPKAKKRTSDEFERDQFGELVSKVTGLPLSGQSDREKDREERIVRKHRSLGVGAPSVHKDKMRDRRRTDSAGLTLSSPGVSKSASRSHHSHQSSSSSQDTRRVFTDFSHLPPSPSTSSILPQLFRHTESGAVSGGDSDSKRPNMPSHHSSPSVAHSLLRGTQEGWSGLDDMSTAEALRKIDGIHGRTLRARSSIGSGGSRANSRPGSPGSKGVASSGWEGREPVSNGRDKDRETRVRESVHASLRDLAGVVSPGSGEAFSEGSDYIVPGAEDYAPSAQVSTHPPAKHLSKDMHTPGSARSSYVLKRGSASSASGTTGTPTTTASSRDSASLSATTSATSASALSHRHSGGKLRRGSVGSDVSSVHSTDFTAQKDRAAALAGGGEVGADGEPVQIPPVPPLPKAFQSPSSASFVIPSPASPREAPISPAPAEDFDRTVVIPTIDIPPTTPGKTQPSPRAPTKKWSFSNALNLKMPSPSSKDHHAKSPLSPNKGSRSVHIAHGHPESRASGSWSVSDSPGASQNRLYPSASTSSLLPIQSAPGSPTTASISNSRTPERVVPSRTETSSSASTQTTSQAIRVSSPPSKSLPSSKRLTPSSIPFFRRSSSSSMHAVSSGVLMADSPPLPPIMPHHASSASISTMASKSASNHSLDRIMSPISPAAQPLQASRKSSVLSLLKGSSSRKSVSDKSDGKGKDEVKEKKDDKDRSESRISILMGRKRGKTLSSAEPKLPKQVQLPPMQITAIPSSTAHRVASLRSRDSTSMPPPSGPIRSRQSAVTPRSPGTKTSDSSLRSTRQNHLPPIAGSPSVGSTPGTSTSNLPPVSGTSRASIDTKETPTKIPRISSRTSTLQSPATTLKSSGSLLSNRRASLIISNSLNAFGGKTQVDPSPSPQASLVSDFGVLEPNETPTQRTHFATSKDRSSARSSPQSLSRVPRQAPAPPSSSKKPSIRESGISGLRKASAPSISSASSAAPSDSHSQSITARFAGLSPSKSLKLLSPKASLPATRTTPSIASIVSPSTPGSSRQSLSTPSPAPSSADDEEVLADEEMLAYIRRQQARKLANGAKKEELDEMLRFPEPLPPVPPSSPSSLLRSSQAAYLSHYERKEIMEYPKVYCVGAHSEKNQATMDNSTNNYGYDDERGDYIVANHDHLAYRYEIIDVLGKGSFGQVLHCRDHCTGESVAIKIIRNKKRFHHQALVEIKILENLRKWDPEEKHNVIKMTEHFYFRGHLCIAMELLSINLYELIKANGFAGFSTVLIRRFTTQMLGSLALMRHHRVVHCDLKPENVLLQHPAKSRLKVIDFGSSCFEHEKVYTYIQSRFYRSPEVILGMNYHMAIDMWSLGCILAELYTGYPIFPGENEQEQLSCIMEVLGVPDRDLISRSSRKNLFFDRTGAPRPVVNSRGRRRRPGSKTLAQVLRCDEENFVDFIAKCLHWDPERRLKPHNAMRHPFVTAGRKPKVTSPIQSSASRSLLSSSSRPKGLLDTPKKPTIGAPTPLTARVSAARAHAGSSVPATPIGTPGLHLGSSTSSATHRTSYRTVPTTTNVSYHHPSRNLSNGFTATAAKTS